MVPEDTIIIVMLGCALGILAMAIIWWATGSADDFADMAYSETLEKYYGKDANVKPLGWWRDERGMLHGRWPPPAPECKLRKGV